MGNVIPAAHNVRTAMGGTRIQQPAPSLVRRRLDIPGRRYLHDGRREEIFSGRHPANCAVAACLCRRRSTPHLAPRSVVKRRQAGEEAPRVAHVQPCRPIEFQHCQNISRAEHVFNGRGGERTVQAHRGSTKRIRFFAGRPTPAPPTQDCGQPYHSRQKRPTGLSHPVIFLS